MSSVAMANAPETTLTMSTTESALFIENNRESIESIEIVSDDARPCTIIIIIFEDGSGLIITDC
ncbi:hypothetical protein [uncultured Dokdonia sp.]|uniref:hypothetical protein n=1 Tax=uncultured Dokdonia sp. TaxID=575653 RepID=UPI0026330504|nr:hypothetical protein [uncultured Dokdonia sp.]